MKIKTDCPAPPLRGLTEPGTLSLPQDSPQAWGVQGVLPVSTLQSPLQSSWPLPSLRSWQWRSRQPRHPLCLLKWKNCPSQRLQGLRLLPGQVRKEVRDLIPSRGDKPADMHAGMVKTDPSLGPSLWLCIECSYTSKNNSNVYEHIEARHVGSSGYFCSICDKTCPTRNAFRIHNIRYHPNEHWGVYLSHMPKYCPTASSLRNHNDRYHKGSKLPF